MEGRSWRSTHSLFVVHEVVLAYYRFNRHQVLMNCNSSSFLSPTPCCIEQYYWDACWSWLGARPRTALWQTGGNGTHAVRSAVGRAVGRTAGQDCGTGGRPTGYSLYERQYSFRRQPEVTQRGKGVTTLTCFLPRGRRAQARSVGEGVSPCQANLGVSWAFTRERRTGEGCGPFREKAEVLR